MPANPKDDLDARAARDDYTLKDQRDRALQLSKDSRQLIVRSNSLMQRAREAVARSRRVATLLSIDNT